jgi:hypothetical protein
MLSVLAGTLALSFVSSLVTAPTADAREKRRAEAAQVSEPATLAPISPLTMLVSLNKQRIFVYDAKGFITSSRVSTGMPGYDTPKGIYSIIQKEEEHTSNIYEGASMPYMQRLLQTGIAMHAGVVPGYAASHGCIRLPFEFAPKLFSMTTMNERVIVTPDVQSPVPFNHPLLFAALPRGDGTAPQAALVEKTAATASDVGSFLPVTAAVASEAAVTMASAAADRARERARLIDAVAAAKAASVKAADAVPALAKAAEAARTELKIKLVEADKLGGAAKKAVNDKSGAERKVKDIGKRIASQANRLRADQLEQLRSDENKAIDDLAGANSAVTWAADAAARAKSDIDALRANVARADAQSKGSRKAAKAAVDAIAVAEKRVATHDRREANLNLPITVLITPKTGNISIRQGWETIAEAPVTIERPDEELGTYVFTATGWHDQSETALKWTALSVGSENDGEHVVETTDRRSKKSKEEAVVPPATDASKAAAALSRITIPGEITLKIAQVVKPGSTLIISDFDMARSETRPGTDFIVQMPEVIAKISKPERKRLREFDDNSSGGWFFFSDAPPATTSKRRSTGGSNKWGSW